MLRAGATDDIRNNPDLSHESDSIHRGHEATSVLVKPLLSKE